MNVILQVDHTIYILVNDIMATELVSVESHTQKICLENGDTLFQFLDFIRVKVLIINSSRYYLLRSINLFLTLSVVPMSSKARTITSVIGNTSPAARRTSPIKPSCPKSTRILNKKSSLTCYVEQENPDQ